MREVSQFSGHTSAALLAFVVEEPLDSSDQKTFPGIETSVEQRREGPRMPLWVKLMSFAGVALFFIQLPGGLVSLSDAVQKQRAEKAFRRSDFLEAIDGYRELHARYPQDKKIVKHLGFSYYNQGFYAEALSAFEHLQGVKMPKEDVETIDAAISYIAYKLSKADQKEK